MPSGSVDFLITRDDSNNIRDKFNIVNILLNQYRVWHSSFKDGLSVNKPSEDELSRYNFHSP